MGPIFDVTAVVDGERKYVGTARRGETEGAYILDLLEEFKETPLLDVKIDYPEADPLEKTTTKKK